MTDERDQALAALLEAFRSLIRENLREQIQRHARIDPNFDPRKIVGIQIDQEKEKLQRLADKNDLEGEHKQRDIFEALIEWLPELISELAHELYNRA